MPQKNDYLRYLRSDIDRVVRLITDTDRWSEPVPRCPQWTLSDVVTHIGRLHRIAAEALETGAAPDEDPVIPDSPTSLPAWLAEGGERLLKALDQDPDLPAWSFVRGPRTVGFWQRRLSLENAVHRRDVEATIASTTPVPVDLADDGVDEVVNGTVGLGIAQGRLTLPGDVALALRATETGNAWRIGTGPASATLQGPAEHLFLVLWKRLEVSDTDLVWEGDPSAGREILKLPLTP
jgi:uncharacterized protein (TIGR03083 family)